MQNIEIYVLHGICIRLVHAIPAGQGTALILARWIGENPHIFGTTLHVAPAGRHRLGVNPQDWQALALVQPPQVDDAAGLIRFQRDVATRY